MLDGVFTIEFDKYFTDVSVVEGSGTVNGIPLEKGQHFIVPAGYGKCRFERRDESDLFESGKTLRENPDLIKGN